jgi:ABC-type bacteriocin/lantibiotic exporter with double-glycine peptidase domain
MARCGLQLVLPLRRQIWILMSCAVAAGTMMSCAVPVGTPHTPLPYKSEARHLAVPFFPEDSDQCGSVALASILAYWGKPAQPGHLRDELYLPAIRGSLPLDLLTAAKARGLDATSYRGNLSNVISEIDAGHPLIVLLDSGHWIFSQGHFLVITGYDALREGVYVHSGMNADLFLPYERLLNPWNKTNRWTLRVIPANQREST